MLDPPRLWVYLLMLHLLARNHVPAVVEEHAACAGGALVERCHIISHASSLLSTCQRLSGCLTEVVGGGRARILMILAALPQVARPSLEGDERDRFAHPALGRARRVA